MSPISQAVLSSWSFDPMLVLTIISLLGLYLRGWLALHQTLPERFPPWRLQAFAGGLAMLWLAIASPLDAFSGLLLSAHMVQHLLLMYVVPPLILLGAPLLPLVRGLPRKLARDGVAPFLVWPALRRAAGTISHPVACGIVMSVTLLAWHVPAAFELALRSPGWHKTEHACFFGAALLFWWPVIRPFPSRSSWPLWTVPAYLLAADLANTGLSAVLTFSSQVLYPQYLQVPRLFGTTPLGDQSCAGLIMWVPGSLVFLIPATVIAVKFLSPGQSLVQPASAPYDADFSSARPAAHGAAFAPVISWCQSWLGGPLAKGRFDLLTVPIVGPFLRARAARRCWQAVLLLIALAVIADGLLGPQANFLNLAGVLPWTYARGLLIVILLVAGNFFCMACPFRLFRESGRRLGWRQRAWPRALRTKWFGVGLLVLFFWAYEVFALWDKPIWTAWLIINYFLAAFAIDAVFRGASFCKHVCPIGQFQFVTSLVSPLEVKVREAGVCATCQTHDCLRGNERQRGCEMGLHLPQKAGNLDCTFCLDCVRACPHDNIGLLAVAPGMTVVEDLPRSSLGRLSRRPDVAALALVLVFAAFTNAALMTAPLVSMQDYFVVRFGLASPLPVTSILLLLALVLAPATLAWLAVHASRTTSHLAVTAGELAGRFAPALIPLGAAMWAGHFLFHLITGWGSAGPSVRRALGDLGWHLPETSQRESVSPWFSADALHILETILLDAGLLLTLYLMWRIALSYEPRLRGALRLCSPWAGIATALYVAGIWIILQPMELRGLPDPGLLK